MTALLLIRHAASASPGRLAGRTEVPAALPADLAPARAQLARLAAPARLLTSPALRCRQTAAALRPGITATPEPRLWEQDFGAWEGMALTELPDLGPLSRAQLAAHRPPCGESFADLAARAAPALRDIAAAGPAMLVAHAGIIRAALGLALADPAQGLAFEIAPLSATLLRALPGGLWSIGFVNLALA